MKRTILSICCLLTALGLRAQSPLALTLEDFEIQQGETKKVYIAMQNDGYDIIAIEFKMQLPDGLTLKAKPVLTPERIGSGTDDFGDVVASAKAVNYNKRDGFWIFSILSLSDQWPFTGSDGNVIEMQIGAEADMPLGNTSIRLYDIELSTKQAPYYPAAYSNKVTVTDQTTAIADILQGRQSADVYTPEGILVGRDMSAAGLSKLPKGVYIVNGQKMVKR